MLQDKNTEYLLQLKNMAIVRLRDLLNGNNIMELSKTRDMYLLISNELYKRGITNDELHFSQHGFDQQKYIKFNKDVKK